MAVLDRTELIHNEELRLTRGYNHLALSIGDKLGVLDLDLTGTADSSTRLSNSTGCSTTDVEGTHGQLSTRLTDGLSGHYTNSLTRIYEVTAS